MRSFPWNLSLSHHGLCTHSTFCFTECENFQQLQDKFYHHSKAFLSQTGKRWIGSFCIWKQKHTSRENWLSNHHLSRNINSRSNCPASIRRLSCLNKLSSNDSHVYVPNVQHGSVKWGAPRSQQEAWNVNVVCCVVSVFLDMLVCVGPPKDELKRARAYGLLKPEQGWALLCSHCIDCSVSHILSCSVEEERKCHIKYFTIWCRFSVGLCAAINCFYFYATVSTNIWTLAQKY